MTNQNCRTASLLFLLNFLFLSATFAQPSVFISEGQFSPGDTYQAEFTVKDFTDLLSMNFSVTWDEDVLEFEGVQGIDNNFVNASFYNSTDAANGTMTFEWDTPNPVGLTLADGREIFRISFKVIGSCGKSSLVSIGDEPVEVDVRRVNAGDQNINLFSEDAVIGVCTLPLIINAGVGTANQGERVCIPISVENFDSIVALQFTISWDPTVLQFDGVEDAVLPNLGPQNFGTNSQNVDNGMLPFLYDVAEDGGQSYPDGRIFNICFIVIGESGTVTPIDFVGGTAGIEVVKGDIQTTLLSTTGRVFSRSLDGTTVLGTEEVVEPMESICMPITVRDFVDIVSMELLLKWDSEILEFASVGPTDALLGIEFNTLRVGMGELGAEWFSATPLDRLTLDNNTVIFEICFRVVGERGDFSPIDFPLVVFTDIENESSNGSRSGAVTIPAKNVEIYAPNLEGEPGQEVCVPITVKNFENIENFDLPISWEPSVMEFIRVGDINLAISDVVLNESVAEFGQLGSVWTNTSNPQGLSLPDEAVLFKLYFTIPEAANIGDCGPINFEGFNSTPMVIATNPTSGMTYEAIVETFPGELCVLNPDGFTINIEGGNIDQNEQLCFPFTVFNFNEVISFQFSVNWDPTILQYDGFNNPQNLPGLNPDNFGEESVADGQLILTWFSADSDQGTTIDDNNGIFNLCFTAIGEGLSCTPLEVTDVPSPIEVTTVSSNGEKISLNAENSEVCINDALVVVDSMITPESCAELFDGAISIEVEGGTPPYSYLWRGMNFVAQSSSITNLAAGVYDVTIVDSGTDGNALSLVQSYTVPLGDNAPLADAGIDMMLPCDADSLVLDGSGSTPGLQYSWFPLDTGFVQSNGGSVMPTVLGADNYVLVVFDESGCQSIDTVQVFPNEAVIADGGGDQTICPNSELGLDGSNSSAGEEITYLWSTMDGTITSRTDSVGVVVSSAGTYILEVSDGTGECIVTDEVIVTLDQDIPTANAGEDQQVTCDETSAILEGTVSPPGNYDFLWTTEDGNITSPETISTISVDGEGTYVFIVTDLQSGCSDTDTLVVMGNAEFPNVDAGEEQTFGCLMDTLTLNATADMGDNITYTWTTEDGTIVEGEETNLETRVTTAGTYILMVTNMETGCTATDQVTINAVMVDIVADAGEDVSLDCGENSVMLDGTSSTDGDEIAIEWTPAENIQENPDNRLQPFATVAGTYILTVTDAMTGCMAMDTVEVMNGGGSPTIVIAQPNPFECGAEEVILDGSGSDNGDGYTYEWSVLEGSAVITNGDMPIASVNGPGLFQLTVSSAAGCSGSETVEVTGSTDIPSVSITTDGMPSLSCNASTLTLIGDVDTTGQIISFAWGTDNGSFVGDTNELEVNVNSIGVYTLTAINSQNNCESIATIEITQGESTVTAIVLTPDTLNCINEEVSLDATGSTITTNTIISWDDSGAAGAILSGETSLQPIVNTMGTYVLTLTDTLNGCKSMVTVEVSENRTEPQAEASEDKAIQCGQAVNLAGVINSSGANITYQWTTIGEGQIESGANTLEAMTRTAGTYVLTVSNIVNGCSATDTVMITQGTALIDAQTGEDISSCDKNELAIMANLPSEEVIGEWTSNHPNVFIADPTAAETIVGDLQAGENLFIWTLSTAECPAYSADTLIVTLSGQVVANNDMATYDETTEELNLNILTNDILTGIPNFNINLLGDVSGGTINSFENGIINYSAPFEFIGTDELQYELCNLDCPTACDTAIVQINVGRTPGFQDSIANFVPSGITPNNDGVNDELIFDLLEIDPEQYPDRELIVFNRWGDIVHTAKPYENDWQGTGEGGQTLPDGTYYFILRLNINAGIIIKGDITILR